MQLKLSPTKSSSVLDDAASKGEIIASTAIFNCMVRLVTLKVRKAVLDKRAMLPITTKPLELWHKNKDKAINSELDDIILLTLYFFLSVGTDTTNATRLDLSIEACHTTSITRPTVYRIPYPV